MNIAFLTHSIQLYGANRSLLSLAEGLSASHSVSVVAPVVTDAMLRLGSRSINWLRFPGLMSYRPVTDGGSNRFQWLRNAYVDRLNLRYQTKKLSRLLSQHSVDVVYSNSSMIPFGIDAAESMDVPHVWHLREFGDLDYHREPQGGWDRIRARLKSSAAIISVSHAVQHRFIESPRPKRDVVIDNGVISRHRLAMMQSLRRSQPISKNDFRFVMAGVLSDAKGQALAIKALSLLDCGSARVSIDFVGGGENSALISLAKKLGVEDRIRFSGYLDDVFPSLLNADAALMCSHHEAFGRTTAEAMASGLPVIGSDSGGTPELVTHRVNGLLFDGTVDGLADCMSELIADPCFARALGKQALDTAAERFTTERYVERVQELLFDVFKPSSMDQAGFARTA